MADKSQSRTRLDNEQRSYVDINGETYVRVSADDLSQHLLHINRLLEELLKEQKVLNTYMAVITDHKL